MQTSLLFFLNLDFYLFVSTYIYTNIYIYIYICILYILLHILYAVWSFSSLYYCDNLSSCTSFFIWYFNYLFYSFLLTRNVILNHYFMKPAVVCQFLGKFGMFTFFISYTMFFIVFSLNEWAEQTFGTKLWHGVKAVLISKVFHLTHRENF